MSSNKLFIYSVEQQHLRNCQSRINGLTVDVKSGKPYQSELNHYIAVRTDIMSRISKEDLAEMQAFESRVLTPYEKAEEAKAMAKAMAENRDKPSI